MAQKTSEAIQDPASIPDVPAGALAPAKAVATGESPSPSPAAKPAAPEASAAPRVPPAPQEPDTIQPFITRAFETIQHAVEDEELSRFLRAHIKTFREEWEAMSDSAKNAYVHLMTSQLLQRKATATRIMNYEEYILPVPSAQTTLLESIKQSQVKPKKRQPVLLMPPNLRPTSSSKK
jgi:hypothetical protein